MATEDESQPTARARKVGRPRKTTIPLRHFEEALRKARGNNYIAAELLGCSRQNVYQRIQSNPGLQQLMYEIEEENIDRAEWKVQQHIDKDNVTALALYLNNRAQHRGWGRQNFEIRGRLEHDHRHAHLHAHANDQLSRAGIDLTRYSDEQLMAIEEFAATLDANVTTPGSRALALSAVPGVGQESEE